MFAAVVRSFDQPPQFEEFPEPQARGDDEVVVDVLAAGLHPRVRSSANGTHYESDGELPMVPGIDGVGRLPSGETVYFVLPDTSLGSMAERVLIDRRRSVVLPEGVDTTMIAAAMNPAMSAWVALRRRIDFTAGQTVLVLGATGNAGQLAVQIAKHLGAGSVVAAGRDADRLAALRQVGADEVVSLAGDPSVAYATLGKVADEASIDVVLDYVWGTATEQALPAILTRRSDRARPLTWIEIGSMAGLELQLRSEWLRAARIQLVGSGQGSVPTGEIVSELMELASHLQGQEYAVDARAVPLSEVARVWVGDPGSPERIVLVLEP